MLEGERAPLSMGKLFMRSLGCVALADLQYTNFLPLPSRGILS